MQTERGWKGGGGGKTPPPPYAGRQSSVQQCARRPSVRAVTSQLAAQRRARVEKKPSRAKTNPTFRQGPLVQLNKYETDPYFLQNFQSNTTVCLIIYTFCKVCEREIVFVLICRTGRTISGSQLLQNMGIIKQTVVLLWKF